MSTETIYINLITGCISDCCGGSVRVRDCDRTDSDRNDLETELQYHELRLALIARCDYSRSTNQEIQ